MEKPNLRFGKYSSRQLGCYDYGTDTITISSMLKQADQEILDYVIYHELLHKKHKFTLKNGRSYHHTSEFREKEKKFENNHLIEQEIRKLIRRSSIRQLFRLF
jgi:predicted metal-dependent hydrolase